jgi:hypothetical protein
MSPPSLRRPPRQTPIVDVDGAVTPSELLAEQLAVGPARVIGRKRRALVMRDHVVATLGADPSCVTAVCAVSAAHHPAVDVLAALASQDPSGVLVVETVDDAFAFEVTQGRLTGARGVGRLDQLEPFVAEVHRRHPERFGRDDEFGADAPMWMKVARTFVEERVLDQLQLCRTPGARLTLVRGDVEWVGTALPAGVGPTLGHVLLENARRIDERPKVLSALGSLDRVAVPLSEPGQQPVGEAASNGGGGEWDFFSDPDPAALAEWRDALDMFKLCDGATTVRELVEAAMFGEFRALLALRTLAHARHIVLVDQPLDAEPTRTENLGQVVPLHTAQPLEPLPEEGGTSYSMVLKAPRKRVREPEPPRRRATPVVPAIDLDLPATSARAARPRTPVTSGPPPAPPRSVIVNPPLAAAVIPLEPDSTAPDSTAPDSTEIVDPTHAAAPSPAASASAKLEPTSDDDAAPAASSMVAARSQIAGRALAGALPSPTMVMIVLGATGVLATVAAVVALM